MQKVFEKRRWVWLSSACNNRCLFCLDGDKDPIFRSREDITRDMQQGIQEGCTRLVLSGGEASIHPDFILIVREGKKLGYKVQVITNGRMFSYPGFLRKAVAAGLGEITFSIHGHTPELHDSLTRTPGSFDQTTRAIRAALLEDIIVNCDVVLNKKNIQHFPQVMEFLISLGLREFDILHVQPFGYAWQNRKEILYDPEDYIQNITSGLDIGIKAGAVLWTNRIPPEILEGYERFIQDPWKLLDEIRGRKDLFLRGPLECKGEQCSYCSLKDFCSSISKTSQSILQEEDEMIITNQNYQHMNVRDGSVVSLVHPGYDYENYEEIVPRISSVLPSIYRLASQKKITIRNIPPCFIKEEFRRLITKEVPASPPSDLDAWTMEFIGRKKIKALKCRSCVLEKGCEGLFQKYIMKYGFSEIKPVIG